MTTVENPEIPLYETLKRQGVRRELAFPEEEYRRRIAAAQASMRERGLDVLVLHNNASTNYLTGYDSHMPPSYAVTIVPAAGELVFNCAELESPVALYHGIVDDIRIFDWTKADNTAADLAGVLSDLGFARGRIGIELSNDENFANGAYDAGSYLRLRALLPEAEIVDATRLVLELRLIKSEAELAYMRIAGTYTWAALQASIAATREGVNENEIAAAAYQGAVTAGSELMSIDPMLITGWRTGLMPHLPYRRHVVERGDLVYMEYSGTHWRYNAPSMRTTVVGPPSARQQQLADVSIEVLETLIAEARPGRTGHDVAMVAKALWRKVPGVHFHGGYGYAMGMAVQPTWCEQAVYLAEGDERVLRPGQTFHLPINPCYPGEMGVGFSESIVITDDGAELLTPGLDRHLVVR